MLHVCFALYVFSYKGILNLDVETLQLVCLLLLSLTLFKVPFIFSKSNRQTKLKFQNKCFQILQRYQQYCLTTQLHVKDISLLSNVFLKNIFLNFLTLLKLWMHLIMAVFWCGCWIDWMYFLFYIFWVDASGCKRW